MAFHGVEIAHGHRSRPCHRGVPRRCRERCGDAHRRTPAAAPPTWRSRWPAWAGRPGSPPASRRTSTARCSPATCPATTCGSPATPGGGAVVLGGGHPGPERCGVLRLRPGLAAQRGSAARGRGPGRGARLLDRRGARARVRGRLPRGRPAAGVRDRQLRHQPAAVDQRHRAGGGRPDRAAGRAPATWSRPPTRTSRGCAPASPWPMRPRACSASARRPWWSPAAVTASRCSPAPGGSTCRRPGCRSPTPSGPATRSAPPPCTRSASATSSAPVPAARLRSLDHEGWREVLGYAARAAAVTVSRPGADPPYAHELG